MRDARRASRFRWALLFGLLGILFLAAKAYGQSPPLPPAQSAPLTGIVFAGGPGQGLTVSTTDDRFAMTVRARAQVRDTLLATPDLTNEINVKTLRLYVHGHVLSPHLRYFIQMAFGGNDYEAGSATPLFDAWVEYTRFRDINIRVGQFFVPFDRGRTIREFALQFVDRPLIISELSLDRDVGIMLYSTNFLGLHDVLSYNLGIFGGEGRNHFGGSALGFLYVGRLALRPFGAFDDDLEGDLTRLRRVRWMIGIAGAYNQNASRQRSTTGNNLTLGTFDYVYAEADTVFKFAGLSLFGEVIYRQGRTDYNDGMTGGKPAREWSRSAWGYLVQAGVMLIAKLEVTARYAQTFALGDTDPALLTQLQTQGNELGGGINVYLNGHLFKLQADYFYLYGDSIDNGRHQVRLQLDASF